MADYEFGKGVGKHLFPEEIEIKYSPRTGRIRYVYLGEKRLATMRPTDGMFSLSITGANRIAGIKRGPKCFVKASDEVSQFISKGSDVFAAHVSEVDDDVRAGDEVIVIDSGDKVLAVGRALLSSGEMKAFKRGVAVKVRHGSVEQG